ncbi:MAG: ZIP family metal transporter [Candidatus Pacebacteria bacterium]|nr:ZIP family metal transporter [Candidatus Paceibacterota bacterium]
MLILFYILLSAFLVSLLSFVGVLTLFFKERLLNKILLFLVAFSAGALLGGAFLHLLPEAVETAGEANILKVFVFVLLGFCLFYVLEEFIRWHHHHSTRHTGEDYCDKGIKPFSYLILFSDGLHNFLDGLVIAGAFVFSPMAGLTTVLAIALHEIPQELGDFGVLVYGGFKKYRALLVNFLSGLVAVLGALIGYFISNQIGDNIVYFLPFAAGNFIYIACSDLIPEIKKDFSLKKSFGYFCVFTLGILLMLVMKLFSTA